MKRSFPETGRWFKGNLHTHTTLSDGRCPPGRQVADYRAMGYDFLSLTDHNLLAPLTPYAQDGLLLLPGWERDIPYGPAKCLHVVGLFPADTPEDAGRRREKGDPNAMSQQALLDQMRGENAYIILAHPVWSRMEPEEIRALEGFDAIEVFNTGTERLCHAGYADVHWDMLLRMGRRVQGIACDDTHGKHPKGDRFGGWIMLRAACLTRTAVLAALKAGHFYATQGPALHDFFVDGGSVHVACSPCREIHVVTYPARGASVYTLDGAPLTQLDCPLKGGETYVRVECIDAQGRIAWSNPIFL